MNRSKRAWIYFSVTNMVRPHTNTAPSAHKGRIQKSRPGPTQHYVMGSDDESGLPLPQPRTGVAPGGYYDDYSDNGSFTDGSYTDEEFVDMRRMGHGNGANAAPVPGHLVETKNDIIGNTPEEIGKMLGRIRNWCRDAKMTTVPVSEKNSTQEIRTVYFKMLTERQEQESVDAWRDIVMMISRSAETLNETFHPGVAGYHMYLQGWANAVEADINGGKYDETFRRIHEKYGGGLQMDPILQLTLQLGRSALIHHATTYAIQKAFAQFNAANTATQQIPVGPATAPPNLTPADRMQIPTAHLQTTFPPDMTPQETMIQTQRAQPSRHAPLPPLDDGRIVPGTQGETAPVPVKNAARPTPRRRTGAHATARKADATQLLLDSDEEL